MMSSTEKLKELRSLGILLDSKIEGPFGIRFGLDALLGLIPVVGDFSTSLASLYIIAKAAQMGCATPILLRMILNVVFENFVGVVPFLGNVFDFYWKANNKNVQLLEKYLAHPDTSIRRSGMLIGVLFFLLLMVLVGMAYLTVLVFSLVISWITQHV